MADIRPVDKSDSISMAVMTPGGVAVDNSNSMASLNEESMAGVDDTTFKVRQDTDDVMGVASRDGNMLDGLKQELNIPTIGNPQGHEENDESFLRVATMDLMMKYQTSQVLDEDDDDAYVSDSSDEDNPENQEERKGKKKIKVKFNTAGLKNTAKEKPKRLADLVRTTPKT